MRWMRRAILLCALLGWTAAEVRSAPPEADAPAENGNGKDKDKEEKPRENIKDNSFLIEEAYNQEKGVVQHIFNWVGFWHQLQGQNRELDFQYTMEIPLGSEKHQFSFQFPMQQFTDVPDGGPSTEQGGVGDMQLNYRYQLLFEDEHGWRPAVAPRLSVILPTGDKTRGLGNGQVGYQFNLPVSKQVEPFAFHFNAGFTYTPNVTPFSSLTGIEGASHDLHGYNLGACAIWLASYDVNFLLEWVIFWGEAVDEIGLIGTNKTMDMILNPGIRWAVYTEGELQWVLGIGVPIGLSRDAPDIGVFGYMSVEHRAKKEKKNGNGK